MRMRSVAAVRIERSCASVVPTYWLAGLVPVLPVSAHAVVATKVAGETCDSRPVLPVITTRSRPARLEPGVAPPSEVSVVAPVTPKVFDSVVAPVTPSVPAKLPLPEAVTSVVLMPPLAVSRFCTPKVLLTCVAPPTVNALSSVVAPVTRSVLLMREAPTTVSVSPRVVAPVTPSAPPKLPVPEAVRLVVLMPALAVSSPLSAVVPPTESVLERAVAPPTLSAPFKVLSPRIRRPPFTSRGAVGAVVLMPTKPALAPEPRMRMRSVLVVRIARSCASRVPRKLSVGLVPVLPMTAQEVAPISVAVETCDNRPLASDITTRSRPTRLVFAVPPSEVSVVAPVTPKVLLTCVAPPTVNALSSVVAPVTRSVLLMREAPPTVSVSESVVAPITPSVPPKLPVPEAVRLVVLMPAFALSKPPIVVAPVTPSALLICVAPPTVSVLASVVAPLAATRSWSVAVVPSQVCTRSRSAV